ncbi:hypothetical protein PSAC2689_180145 [Paraburkholderia sacchari]
MASPGAEGTRSRRRTGESDVSRGDAGIAQEVGVLAHFAWSCELFRRNFALSENIALKIKFDFMRINILFADLQPRTA